MSKPFKVHELLSADELSALEAFAREPGRTIDECHEWLEAKGYVLSRSAVGTWKRSFDEIVMRERFANANGLASSLVAAAKESGAVAISDAAILQLSQVVLEQSLRLQSDGEIKPRDVVAWSRALRNLVGSKGEVEALRERQKLAVSEAAKAAATGAGADAVVSKVREILGIPAVAGGSPA